MAIEGGGVGDWSTEHSRKNDWGVSEDHREGEPQKTGVKHRIIGKAAHGVPKPDKEDARCAEPDEPADEADSDESGKFRSAKVSTCEIPLEHPYARKCQAQAEYARSQIKKWRWENECT